MITKEEAKDISVKLMQNIYQGNFAACASILNADAKMREDGDCSYIVGYLKDTKIFISQLINILESKEE